ncbi:hypothetical protein BKG91_01690 [Rodentibacter caecimuris]|uniref:Murein endopeptidase K n=1 Tax=Rodentibacter caecimuris TaxID=1796644 RepID=A0AAJ3MYL0_9PAST|nr:YcbK family protein [Rodentibacter heylii]AOF54138.1 exported protein [Pasteurellaceae bacterium NI1060]OOF70096.1 hypothetical protein BKG90_10645 [Rodentibacter heylii]OOF75091.1 hypothetical protein BKG99_09090 [Rodentibacter heylii]OOF76020.1 hypothetical protein BKG91_01690 [Rodentibacter heylii]
MNKINQSRRKWLSLGGIVLGASIVPNTVLAMVSTAKPRILALRNVNTGERLSGVFSSKGGFSTSMLKKLDYFMRDKRTNQIHRMDPNLFLKLYRIQSNLGLQTAEIQIICGYRSPATNAMRHRQSRGVASNSYHVKGQAVDFRIDGTSLVKIKQTAEKLNNGGVGFYPRSNFIHVDTGSVRTWRGV